MRVRIAAAAWLLVSAAATCPAGTPKPVTVTFYHTSDLHDHSGPLPRIARLVAERREKDPNTLFVDTGDWMNKGDLTPLQTRGEAVAETMGAMGYDAVIPGNHDFTFGAGRLAELVDKHSLPLLDANCRWRGEARPRRAAPYRIHRLEGVTVAIVGAAPPFVGDEKGASVEILPVADAVRDAMAELDGKADIMVLLTHVGPPEDRKLIRALPRVDILFGGHHHKRFASLDYDKGTKTILQHSGFFGETVGEVVVTWDGKEITGRRSRLVKVTGDMPESEAVKAVLEEKYVPAKAPAGADVAPVPPAPLEGVAEDADLRADEVDRPGERAVRPAA